ncbi:MAG: serine/threonine protein kinase [Gemmataceae bacterium]|nr:serine/threonine protein kinase [Gemmataceae bacterium]
MTPPPDFPTGAYDPAAEPPPDPARTYTFGGGNAPPPDKRTAAGMADDDRPPAPPGFEIVRELGRGGMGVVYLARDVATGREVALKVMLTGGHASAADRARFVAEATTMAKLQHPGVTPVYQIGEHDGRPFLVMEYVPGGTLARRLDGTPLPPREAAGLVAVVARGVHQAHERGVVHRDIKPGNVLLAADGAPKLADFGLARYAGSDSHLTATGAVLGSPSYMAPEQAAGDAKRVGPAADVYGLGAVLYECLTGRPPFRAATAIETITQVLNAEPAPPRVVVPGLPRDLETITLKCLQKDPAKRYASAAALADDLDHFLDGRPITARPVPAWERAWRWVRRHPAAGVIAGVIFAAVGTVLGVLASANAKLQRERDAADRARAEAVVKGEEADRERAKAQARLTKAVEAVEKMTGRVGTAKWARDPSLAAERRQVLEDVAAYYEHFGDADDPLVRRETARAYRRIGGAYLLMAEYKTADDYLGRARAVGEKLAADFPAEPGYAADLAEAELFAGHAASSNGRAAAAQDSYRAATDAARRAVAGRPADDDARRTLVACLIGQGFFRMQVDRATAAPLFREAVGLSDDLLGRPNPPFGTRALAAYSYVAAATFDFQSGRIAEGQAKVDTAEALLTRTPPDPAAPAHYRDLADMTAGVIKMSNGSILAQTRRPAEGVKLLREAAEAFDRLLAYYPKAFQYQLYKVLILTQEAAVLDRLKRPAEADRRRDELLAAEDALLRSSPDATFVRRLTATTRSTVLVRRVQDGKLVTFGADAAALLETARELGAAGDGLRYNVACAFSLASTHGTSAERDARAAEAVKLLAALLDGNFYLGPTNAAHVDKDTDLEPVRGRDDFKDFRAKLAALPPPKAP